MRTVNRVQLVAAIVVLASTLGPKAGAQTAVPNEPGRRVTLVQPGTPGYMPATTAGAELCIGWNKLDWKIGSVEGSDSVWAPEIAAFYVVDDSFDVRLSAKFASGEDQDQGIDTEGSFFRLNLGARYWIDLNAFVTPYVGASLGYYNLDMDAADRSVSVDSGIGFNVQTGCAFGLSDGFLLTLGLTYDRLLMDADATVDGESVDASISALGVDAGVVLLF